MPVAAIYSAGILGPRIHKYIPTGTIIEGPALYMEEPAPTVIGWLLLLRGAIVNRTYGIHKNLPGIHLPIFTNNIWSYLLWSPVIEELLSAQQNTYI